LGDLCVKATLMGAAQKHKALHTAVIRVLQNPLTVGDMRGDFRRLVSSKSRQRNDSL
jgi:hypothetical protein